MTLFKFIQKDPDKKPLKAEVKLTVEPSIKENLIQKLNGIEPLTELKNQFKIGDSAQVLKAIPNDSIDLLVTDPPYGLEFMGKDWDKALPPKAVWKECFRVLKAGSFGFVCCSPRQDLLSRLIVDLSDAGFNVDFTSIYWAYASGFPKAMNMSKAIDKKKGLEREVIGFDKSKWRDLSGQNHLYKEVFPQEYVDRKAQITKPASKEAEEFEGAYAGYQPKPAVEIVVVVMKPLSEKNYVEQALKNGKGVTWIDQTRIPIPNNDDPRLGGKGSRKSTIPQHIYGAGQGFPVGEFASHSKGRFPANLVVSDQILNDGVITKSKAGVMKADKGGTGDTLVFAHGQDEVRGHSDEGEFSRYFDLDIWFGNQLETKGTGTVPKRTWKGATNSGTGRYNWNQGEETKVYEGGMHDNGRFPANLLISDDILDTGNITKSSGGSGEATRDSGYTNKYANVERGADAKPNPKGSKHLGGLGDTGDFSRFFSLDSWFQKQILTLPESQRKTFPFLIVTKPSKKEKNLGLANLPERPAPRMDLRKSEDIRLSDNPKYNTGKVIEPTVERNFHPTVKPISLMAYLIALGSRKGDIILDPFVGSGTTALAAGILERNYFIVEQNEEYAEIIKNRLKETIIIELKNFLKEKLPEQRPVKKTDDLSKFF